MKSFRLLHALFGATVLAAYFTSEETGALHAWIGYGAAALILVRLGLGIARRSGFSFERLSPRLGHAPAAMSGLRHPFIARSLTLALALLVGTSALTGVMMDQGGTFVGNSVRDDGEGGEREDDEHERDSELSASLLGLAPAARADDGEGDGDEDEGPLAELHEAAGNLILPFALLHIAYMLLFRFGMSRFMLFLPVRRRA